MLPQHSNKKSSQKMVRDCGSARLLMLRSLCVEEYERISDYQIRLPKFDKFSLFVCRGLSQWMDLKAFRLTRKFVTYPSAPVGSGTGQHDSFLLDLFNSVAQGGALQVRFRQRVLWPSFVDPRPRRWPLRPAWCPSPGEWRAWRTHT